MIRTPRISLISVILVSVIACNAVAESEEEKRVQDATTVLTEIMDIPEEGIPASLLAGAHGLAVMPNMIKVGFVIGGKYGKGILVVRKDDGSCSRPVFLNGQFVGEGNRLEQETQNSESRPRLHGASW